MAAHRDRRAVDGRLRIARAGAGVVGVLLLAFGVLGLLSGVGFFDTRGTTVVGLGTNGTLSVLSLCVGLLLVLGMTTGGRSVATLDLALGTAFLVSGFVNLALLDTAFNVLAFRGPNVVVSFAVGVWLVACGMYGRSGRHPPRAPDGR